MTGVTMRIFCRSLNSIQKVATEVVFTPMTYWVAASLKRTEDEGYYDGGTDFGPLPAS
jgi:hypothetical protein